MSQWAVVRNPLQNRTHLPKQISNLGDADAFTGRCEYARTGRAGRGTLGINVARAPARFRAFPDDTGIALKGDKLGACVGPILKLLDGHVIAGLAAGTAGEECPRDIDHVRRALALVEQRRTAPGAEASGRLRRCILEASDASSALRHAGTLAPTTDIGRIRCAVRATARRGVIVPGPKAGKSISSSTAPQRQRPDTCRLDRFDAARSLRLSSFMLSPAMRDGFPYARGDRELYRSGQ